LVSDQICSSDINVLGAWALSLKTIVSVVIREPHFFGNENDSAASSLANCFGEDGLLSMTTSFIKSTIDFLQSSFSGFFAARSSRMAATFTILAGVEEGTEG
jgi:hypothetical protein